MQSFLAPAKINLSLRVLGKRTDGFHEIDTLMVRLPGLCDSLVFEESERFSFSCDDPSVPSDESNLVVKAVRAFESATGTTCKFHISLSKVIPHGAGLAGGSSDAATTLSALNELHGNPLDQAALSGIAASLGSDIPFFLGNGAARCTGRGEIITPVPSIPPIQLLLLKPTFAVSTPDAYGRWHDAKPLPGISHDPVTFPWGQMVNDLELPVFRKHRFLAEMKQWLLDRGLSALMSGSGSTIFAILDQADDAEKHIAAARDQLDPTLWSWTGATG
ncbi:4-(cytidine 5'-diphospho)-2-C-methyl-D-erythritol kinase [Luteolibacter pohnpeiensis]|uniref:4-diphosphocytidyl-2-C-methyl-D-erythritol kinase n=1 Tax=Luteolibacter pohnpeiensis TaxID=454153 RepID=A0A934S9K6_9BACT|nr:4-(cytidine 5'-diphospho)-2-C-methyl-D-erythritol kinase [Luteolibacter pohnpeiensis]MBK1883396.1 4-(cytidine 5'-diphospho)-2-C-methyl-D-erythritol kinase [Luteolibacter pohnpeiensis]